MKYLLAALALMFSFNVSAAERVATWNQLYIVLATAPCTNAGVLENIDPSFHARFKAGTTTVISEERAKALGKKVFQHCWTLDEEGIHLISEAGSFVILDPALFAAPSIL